MTIASTLITRMQTIWDGYDVTESTLTGEDWENSHKHALELGGKATGIETEDDDENWLLFVFPDHSACWVMEAGHGTKELVF